MEVVLLEPVSKLGQTGEIVTVKNGFARNFLIPNGVALRATKENIAVFEDKKKEIEAKNADKKKAAEGTAKKVNGLTVTIIRQAAEDGRLYGSVTVREIAENIKEQGFEVESSSIDLLNPIKAVGKTDVRISLYADVAAEIVVNVARSEAEADAQLVAELEEDEAEKEAAKIASIEGAVKAAEAAKLAAEQAEAEANAEEGEEAATEEAAEDTAEEEKSAE